MLKFRPDAAFHRKSAGTLLNAFSPVPPLCGGTGEVNQNSTLNPFTPDIRTQFRLKVQPETAFNFRFMPYLNSIVLLVMITNGSSALNSVTGTL